MSTQAVRDADPGHGHAARAAEPVMAVVGCGIVFWAVVIVGVLWP